MSKINNYDNLIINHYNNYEEDIRFERKSHKFEYLTTMRYIQKYAKKGAKILEIGAGTGAYSIPLAKLGYKVTAVELVQKNIDIMTAKAKDLTNLNIQQGDALDLSRFNDNSFDIVLNLGPMYHLYTAKDKNKAIAETVRVCKPNGICMFAYLTHSSIIWNSGVRKNEMESLLYCLTKDFKFKDIPKEIFTSFYIEDFNKLFEKTNTTYLKNVATDGIAPLMRDYIDNTLSDKHFEVLLNWHYSTCERLDHQGLSSHMLYICKKNK